MSYRLGRINSILRKEISQILLEEIDFDNALVTVTEVITRPNLTQADVLLTVMPDKEEEKALKILGKNLYDIQKTINKRLKTKPVPKISFKIDEGIKNLYRIDEISSK